MKLFNIKYLLIALFLITCQSIVFSQCFLTGMAGGTYTSTNVTSYQNIQIQGATFNGVDYPAADIACLELLLEAAYPGVQVIAPATYQYNCHAFAFHISEGENTTWINNTTTSSGTNVNKYFDCGAFYEVAQNEYPDKIHYYAGDHSGVIAPGYNTIDSKWGTWPKLRHNVGVVPILYSPTYRRYYKKTNILGEFSACGTTLSLPNFPNAQYSWSTSNSQILTIGTGSNTKDCTFNKISNGTVTVTCTLTTSCNTRSYSKIVTVSGAFSGTVSQSGQSTQNLSATQGLVTNNQATIPLIFGTNNNSSISVNYASGGGSYTYNSSSKVLNVTLSSYQSLILNISGTDNCGNTFTRSQVFYPLTGGYYMVISPNPASNILSIEAKKVNEYKGVDKIAETELNMEISLFHSSGNQVLTSNKNKGERNVTFPINNLKSGIYTVKINYNGYSDTKQVYIFH